MINRPEKERPSDFHTGLECPGCGESCARVALVQLLYLWEPCQCSQVNYPHLSEQVWHRSCYIAMQVE